jgi:hypothetical protein
VAIGLAQKFFGRCIQYTGEEPYLLQAEHERNKPKKAGTFVIASNAFPALFRRSGFASIAEISMRE